MAASYYMKLYYEILDDRKMAKLPDRAWRRCLEIFLYAGELHQDGVLPPTEDIAWRLRVDEDDLAEDIELLESVGILAQYGEGWLVVKFAERQKAIEAKDRMKRMRERKPAPGIEKTQEIVSNGGDSGGNDDDVTTRYETSQNGVTRSVTKRNTDVDKIRLDTDNIPTTTAGAQGEEPKSEFAQCVDVLALKGVYLDSFTSQLVQDCYDDISPQGSDTKLDWFTYACKEAAGQRASWKFLDTIIRGVNDSGSLSAHEANRQTKRKDSNGQRSVTQGKREVAPQTRQVKNDPYKDNGQRVSSAGLPIDPELLARSRQQQPRPN